MAIKEQEKPLIAKQRRRFLSLLACFSCCFHLAALTCVVLITSAGTTFTALDSQGPAQPDHGWEALVYREFALVQFSTNISVTTPTLYWYLDAFGWQYFVDAETDSAGWVYLGAGRTLRFPDAMNSFINIFNLTVGVDTIYNNCTYHVHEEPTCVFSYDNKTIAGFAEAPSLAASTAPVFVFYILAMIFTALLVPLKLTRSLRGRSDTRRGPRSDRREYILLALYAIAPVTHLIAAACATGAAARVINYLRDTPEIATVVWNVSMGTSFLRLVWLGFIATLLGSLTSCLRWWLRGRWKATLEWEAALALADIRSDRDQWRRAAQEPGQGRPSEPVSIRTDGSDHHGGDESAKI